MSNSIILLSGGLDSLVCLEITKDSVNYAITFDYGQICAQKEIESSANIAKYYGIKHEIIKLDWLKNITNNALTGQNDMPSGIQDNCNSVWVPNRNGLFLNIAASYADSYGFDSIVFGANKDEAVNFSDNSMNFVEKINDEFEYSTQVKPKIVTPLINFTKDDIVKQGLVRHAPLELIYSCYRNGEKHCGKCESCIRLKNALIANNDKKFIGILFE